MPETQEKIQLASKETSAFQHARDALMRAISVMPHALRPRLDFQDPYSFLLLKDQDFVRLHILMLQEIYGVGLAEATFRAKESSQSRVGVSIHQTGQIALRYNPKKDKANPEPLGLDIRHKMLLIGAHEAGHQVVPFIPGISFEEALLISGFAEEEIYKALLTAVGYDGNILRYDQVGRDLEVYVDIGLHSITGKPLGVKMNSHPGTLLHETFSNAYMQYVDFITYCLVSGYDYQTVLSDNDMRQRIMAEYALTKRFSCLTTTDELTALSIYITAKEFYGYEELLLNLLNGLQNPKIMEPFDWSESQGQALANLFLVGTAQSLKDTFAIFFNIKEQPRIYMQTLAGQLRLFRKLYQNREILGTDLLKPRNNRLNLAGNDFLLLLAELAWTDERWSNIEQTLKEITLMVYVAEKVRSGRVETLLRSEESKKEGK